MTRFPPTRTSVIHLPPPPFVSGKQRQAGAPCEDGHGAQVTLGCHLHCLCLCYRHVFYATTVWCIHIRTQPPNCKVDVGVGFGVNNSSEIKKLKIKKQLCEFDKRRSMSQSTRWRVSGGQQRLMADWLLRGWDVTGRQPSTERLPFNRGRWPSKPSGSWRPLFYTFLVSPKEGLSSRFKRSTGSHARKTYLTTVHMLIYGTTTSICAFWTVTKWCFIACCIDDANYNCSSTILE